MTAPQPILDLVERFDHNLDAYHSGRYKETQLQRQIEATDKQIDALIRGVGADHCVCPGQTRRFAPTC